MVLAVGNNSQRGLMVPVRNGIGASHNSVKTGDPSLKTGDSVQLTSGPKATADPNETIAPSNMAPEVSVPGSTSPSPKFEMLKRLFRLDQSLADLKNSPDKDVQALYAVLTDETGKATISQAQFGTALAKLNKTFAIKDAQSNGSNNFLNFFFQNDSSSPSESFPIDAKTLDQALRDIDLTYKTFGGEGSERSVLNDFNHKGSFRAVNANKQGENLKESLNLGTKSLKEYISEVYQKDPNSVLSNAYLRLNPGLKGEDPSWDDLATLMLLIGKNNYIKELMASKDKESSTKSKEIDQAMSSSDEQGLKDVIQELAKGNSGREKFDGLNQRVTLTDENKSSFFSFLSSPFTSKP